MFQLRTSRPARCLLCQAEPNLNPESRHGTGEGVCDQWLVDGAFEISLNSELLIYNVADVGPKLEIKVSVGDSIHLVDLALDRLVIADGDVHAKRYIVLENNGPTL